MLRKEALQKVLDEKRSARMHTRSSRWDSAKGRVDNLMECMVRKGMEVLKDHAMKRMASAPPFETDEMVIATMLDKAMELRKKNASLKSKTLLRKVDKAEVALIERLRTEKMELCSLFEDRGLHAEKAEEMFMWVRNMHAMVYEGKMMLPFTRKEFKELHDAMLELAEAETLLSRDVTHIAICSFLLEVKGPLESMFPRDAELMNAYPAERLKIAERTVWRRPEVAAHFLELLYPDNYGELIGEVLVHKGSS